MKNSFSFVANPLLINPLLPEVEEANREVLPYTEAGLRADRMIRRYVHGPMKPRFVRGFFHPYLTWRYLVEVAKSFWDATSSQYNLTVASSRNGARFPPVGVCALFGKSIL